MAEANVGYTLTLTEVEAQELLRVLQQVLTETHGENRRTENPDYRSELRREEGVLRSLVEKVRQLRRP